MNSNILNQNPCTDLFDPFCTGAPIEIGTNTIDPTLTDIFVTPSFTEKVSLIVKNKDDLLSTIKKDNPPTETEIDGVRKLLDECDEVLQVIKNKLKDELLIRNELVQYLSNQKRVLELKAFLELWKKECEQSQSQAVSPQLCIYVEDELFPGIIKHKQIVSQESSPVVTLMLGPRSMHSTVQGSVTAKIRYTEGNKSIEIVNNTQLLDDEGKAIFSAMKFETPSSKNLVYLTFKADVTIDNRNMSLECDSLKRFIITSHENQWQDSASKLLYRSLFDGCSSISASELQNKIQLHYLMVTGQPYQKITRALTPNQLRYLSQIAMKGKHQFTTDQFCPFWEWYGVALHKIRFDKCLKELWSCGQMFGFMSRSDAESILLVESIPVYSFLFRFSERKPRMVVIAVKIGQNCVKQIMLQGSELKRLPAVIMDHSFFYNLVTANEIEPLYFDESFCFEESPKLQIILKHDSVLQKYISSCPPQTIPTLYSSLTNPYSIA